MSNNVIIKGKKSISSLGKQKINLYSSVVDFNVFSEMIKSNQLPLVVRLSTEKLNESNSNYQSNMLKKYYIRKCQFDDEFSNIYMVLDSVKLEREFYEEKLYIDKYFDNVGQTYKVDVLYPGDSHEGFTKIGLFKRKGILFDKSSIIIYSIRDMYTSAYKKYMENNKNMLLASIDQEDDISFVKKKK